MARITPRESFTIPSHFNTAPIRGFKRAWRNMGIITVGPVTTNIAPNGTATAHCRPAI